MKRLKKIFTSAVMLMTVVVMSGVSFAPTASAAAQAGDLIKKDGLSAVYYLGEDGKRYVFPNESTFKSWYSDFSSVVTVSADELASYPLGANVVVRPGTKLVKITTDPKVYAVEPNGSLRWVQTEADAIALYGANWAQRVIDVADSFFTNYTISTPLASNEVPVGSLVKKTGENNIYYYDGTDYRLVEDEVAFLANRFQHANVLTHNTFTASGSTITGAETAIVKTSQSGAAQGWQPGQGTGVTVALNSTTPASQSVPSTVGRIPFVKVNITASADGATHLESITVKRTGLTTYGTTFRVWAEKDGNSVSSKRALTTNDDAVLTFAPTLVIPAGQTVTLEILAEVAGVSGNGALGIASASAVSASGATVSGSFPINGNLMSFTTYDVTGLKFATSIIANNTVKVGDEDVELAKFNLQLTGTTTRDVVFKTLTLRNNGVEDLASVVMNMRLENAGEVVSNNATFNGRYATFVLKGNGMDLLRDDNNYDLTVKGDIIGKDNSGANSIALRLNKKDELYAYEKATGFGITYDYNDGLQFSTVEIQSGAVDISKKSTSPAAQDVVKSSKNVLALVANVRADEVINADSFKLKYEGDVTSFQNAKVYLNGALLGSFVLDATAASTTVKYETIDSSLSLNKGNNEIKVAVDVKTNAIIGESFKVTLEDDFLTAGSPEYANNGLSVTDINGTATGAKITVTGGGMTFTRNDGYAAGRKAVEGTTDVSLGKFAIKATDDAIKLTSVVLGAPANGGVGATTSATHIYDMKLFVDGVQIGTTRNLGSSGVTFSSLNYGIAKNATKIIELKGSFTSEAANTATTSLRINVAVNAQDSLGKTIDSQNENTARFEITKGGRLVVAKGASTPYSRILIAKESLEQEVAQFRLTAIDDSATVSEIKLYNASTTATTTVITTADPRISSYRLYKGSSLLDTAVPAGDGYVTFNISGNGLVVPANGSETLTVKAIFNSIVVSDDTNQQLALLVKEGSIKAKSSSGVELDQTNISGETGAISNLMFIRKTKPTFSKVNDGITGGASSAQEVARFKIAADAGEDLRLTAITFTRNGVASTTPTGYRLYEIGNPTELASSDTAVFADFSTVINKGTDKTYRVIANTSAVADGETFGLSLSNVVANNAIVWGEYFVTGYENYDSTYVEELPLDFGSMKY